MKIKMVDGVLGGLVAFAIVGACSPRVTVSRDADENAGGAGAEDSEGGAGDTGGKGGTAGSAGRGQPAAGAGAGPMGGTGGDGVFPTGGVAGDGVSPTGGVAGDWSIAGAGAGGGGGTAGMECPCSRRPGSPISRNCPRGAGTSQTTTIGVTGGDAQLTGTTSTIGVPFRVRVFAGSLTEDTEIELTELTQAAPEEFFDYSPVYRVEPDDLEFVNGGEVSIPWQVPSGFVPTLAIYFSESPDGPFELMEDSYQNAGFSQATLLRSGYFFVGNPKPEGYEQCP
jgi:hypothetical protein